MLKHHTLRLTVAAIGSLFFTSNTGWSQNAQVVVGGNSNIRDTITAHALKATGAVEFDSLRVLKRIKVGAGTLVLENDPGGLPNSIYTNALAPSGLLIQSNAAFSNNTIINANNMGMVGIGTTDPQVKLHIKGSEETYPDCSAKLRLEFQTSSIPNGCGFFHSTWDFGAVASGLNISTPVLSSPVMTLTNTGNVEIGTMRITSGPHTDYKLSIDGKIVARKVVTTALNWADDELKKETSLDDIEKEEQFTKKNSHLSDVPSEKEVLDKGIVMDEMFTTHIRKIEQLFKYSFKFNHAIKQLNENIFQIQNENLSLKKENEELKQGLAAMQNQIAELNKKMDALIKK